MDPIYWRLQDAGYALSQSHQSSAWGEDGGEAHEATSCVASIDRLYGCGALLGDGAIEIVAFSGVEIGKGADREPIVVPLDEVRRLRLDGPRSGHGIPARASTVEDLLAAGWREVPTMAVLD